MNFYTTPPIHQNFCAKAHFRRTRIKYFCIGVLPGLGQNRSVGEMFCKCTTIFGNQCEKFRKIACY